MCNIDTPQPNHMHAATFRALLDFVDSTENNISLHKLFNINGVKYCLFYSRRLDPYDYNMANHDVPSQATYWTAVTLGIHPIGSRTLVRYVQAYKSRTIWRPIHWSAALHTEIINTIGRYLPCAMQC